MRGPRESERENASRTGASGPEVGPELAGPQGKLSHADGPPPGRAKGRGGGGVTPDVRQRGRAEGGSEAQAAAEPQPLRRRLRPASDVRGPPGLDGLAKGDPRLDPESLRLRLSA